MSEQVFNGLNSQARSANFPAETRRTIIDLAIKGSKEEQEWFFRRYATPIFCFLKKRGLTPDEAKDVTLDLIVKFLDNKFHNFDFSKPFKSYLMTVAENEAKSFKKKKGIIANKVEKLFEELSRDAEKNECSSEATPEEAFDLAYARQLFGEAFRQVKDKYANDTKCPNHWNMFCDRVEKQLTWPEIANRFGYTRDQARNRTLVIFANFKKALREELRKEQIDNIQLDSKLRYLMSILARYK